MKRASVWFILLTGLLFASINLHAIPASPYPIKITQPDGTEITIRLHGDEYFKYKTTLDGYALIDDANGFLTYAQQDASGNLITTNVKANDIADRTTSEIEFLKQLTPNISFAKQNTIQRAQRAAATTTRSSVKSTYPLGGTPKSLVILVNFSDKSFVTSSPSTAFTNLLNLSGYSTNGGTGSAKDYFKASSMGNFSPEFDVVGPYTLPNAMAYYGGNDSSGDDKNPRQMVIDACKLASAAGVDFSQYDTDGDGFVDNIFIYYAGNNEAEGAPANTVWPHRWTLADYSTKFNGKIVFDYACTSELRGISGSNMCGVGTFCHEFGHVLGLDDMYNTNNDYSYNTLSYWDIMDSGPYLNSGRTPPAYSAYERFYLNWLTPVELKSPKIVTLDTLTTSNKAYLISQTGNHNLSGTNPSPVEFFLLENRQNKGWDTYLPGHGMLATHIYYNSTIWTNNTPNNTASAMGVDIVEADKVASDATLSGDPFPGTSKVTSWSPTLRSGTNISKPLTFITEQNGIIRFRFMGGANIPPVATAATDITIASFVAHWNKVYDASGYYFTAYNLSEGESKLTEGFNNGLVAPTDWTITATGTSTSPTYSGDSIPSVVFRNSGEMIQTEQYLLPATSLSFFIKTLSGLNGCLSVEAMAGTTWNKVDSISVTSSLNTTKTYSFTTDQNYTQFRLTYTKVTGYLAVDDIAVSFSQNLEYNAHNIWLTETTDTLINLVSNRDYYYKVKASDKTLNSDNTIKYENITDFSNLIHVQTFESKAKTKTLIAVADSAYVDNTGTINLYIPSTRVAIIVYNTLGQQVRSITNPATNRVEISGLPRNQIYIIKAGQQITKVIL